MSADRESWTTKRFVGTACECYSKLLSWSAHLALLSRVLAHGARTGALGLVHAELGSLGRGLAPRLVRTAVPDANRSKQTNSLARGILARAGYVSALTLRFLVRNAGAGKAGVLTLRFLSKSLPTGLGLALLDLST